MKRKNNRTLTDEYASHGLKDMGATVNDFFAEHGVTAVKMGGRVFSVTKKRTRRKEKR